MKTVYVAQREYDCEGFMILGIFETREEAEERTKRGGTYGDFHDIEKFVIGEYVE